MNPLSPARAYQRLMLYLIEQSHDDASPTPEELERAAIVFSRAGGSWESVYKGSVEDIALLKKVIRIAVKKGYFSKSQKWS